MNQLITYQLPHNDNEKEIIYLITTTNRTNLSLASNFPYELWINDKFIGIGGHRCADTEIYIDNWPNLLTTDMITIKYQWFNSTTCNIWYRRIFPIAVFVDLNSTSQWNLNMDNTIKIGNKISPQLPHQNIISKSHQHNSFNHTLSILDECPYTIKQLPVKPCEYIDVTPKLIKKIIQLQCIPITNI